MTNVSNVTDCNVMQQHILLPLMSRL